MIDLALTAFVFAVLAAGVRRPFLWVLAYVYIDILAPQKISWMLLTHLPISLIAFVLAFAGWAYLDDKAGSRFSFRQALIALLLVYCGLTTLSADLPEFAAEKWSWVWKALVFALFLPLTLRTRLRMEALTLVMVLSAAAIIIPAGIKTLASGGGYGSLHLLVNDNTGLYEGSTLSMVAVAIIPLVLWLARFGTIILPGRVTWLFAVALSFACLLIPVGTQTRTGLICIAVLAVLLLRSARHRLLYLGLGGAVLLAFIPLLPQSYFERMQTIESHSGDQSASTRLAVWAWTWEFAADRPFGGGFEAYRQNRVTVETTTQQTAGNTTAIESQAITDKGRAYHSSYFEMLGEQGFPGLVLWLVLHGMGLIQMESVRRRLRRSTDRGDQSLAALAGALQQGHAVYLVGSLFIGIAFQPFVYMLVGLQIAVSNSASRRIARLGEKLALESRKPLSRARQGSHRPGQAIQTPTS